ncbi:MAG TPA: hypothetical protein QF611_09220 [Pseudomonadales bacterium]|nr:hypothetical protein [Pseudomonadales bacterium]MDP6314701.1 hypothetical protein [Pseudomonadales bacterium]HJP51196.1 hypothetical protein [Pseudomonadales bacterium]
MSQCLFAATRSLHSACLATFQALYLVYKDRLTFGVLGLIIHACILPLAIAMKVFQCRLRWLTSD